MVNLSDGIYELTPAGKTIMDDCSVNLTELNQDPDQSSKEPKAAFDSAQEGKPRCIIPFIFGAYFTFIYPISAVIIFPRI